MGKMRKEAISIIVGSDGPTSVFVAGKTGKQSVKMRIKNAIYRRKQKKAKKRIHPGSHTLEEVLEYAKEHYDITEISTTQRRYEEQKKCWKEGVIWKYKPELLGELRDIEHPDTSDKKAMDAFLEKVRQRSKVVEEIPDCEIAMDFHIYEIKYQGGTIEIAVDYHWEMFDISYRGNKKRMKTLGKIAQELYLYYGVTQEDIERRTVRYSKPLLSLSV